MGTERNCISAIYLPISHNDKHCEEAQPPHFMLIVNVSCLLDETGRIPSETWKYVLSVTKHGGKRWEVENKRREMG